MGITYPEARCEESPSKAHHLVGKTIIDAGTMFECKYCHKVKWMPLSFDDAKKMGNLISIYGLDGGYQRMLDKHPAARRMLARIQDIYYLRKAVPEEQLPKVIAAIMTDKEYPYDVEIEEEEML